MNLETHTRFRRSEGMNDAGFLVNRAEIVQDNLAQLRRTSERIGAQAAERKGS
jgi:hypothetical protein